MTASKSDYYIASTLGKLFKKYPFDKGGSLSSKDRLSLYPAVIKSNGIVSGIVINLKNTDDVKAFLGE